MAVSRRFGLGFARARSRALGRARFSTAFAIALFMLGCGDSGDKEAGGTGSDAGSGTGGQDAGLGPLIEIAELDNNTAGAPCKADADCKGKAAYCFNEVCSGICETNKNCGAGGTCVQPFAGQNGLCSKVCKENSDCAKGQDCLAGPNFEDLTAAIEDAGISTADAGIDLKNIPKTCGPSLGVVELPDGVVGIACSSATPCAPGECAPNINIVEPFPNGYCTGKCLADSDCGAGGVCYKDPVTIFTQTEGRCLLGCSTSTTCRSGQVCRVSAFIDAKSYCLPPVANTASDGGVTNDT